MDEQEQASAGVPPPAPPRRKRDWQGALGMATALALAFVWGGIADHQLSPGTKAARILPAPAAAANTAVLGSEAPPSWIADFAGAFCKGDAQTIAPRIGPPLTNNVEAISNALSDRDWQCNDIRFAGAGSNPKGSFYMYVTRDAENAEQWWIFTVVGEQVVAID